MTDRVCAVNHTVEGVPCRRPAATELYNEPVCGRHALRFAEGEHEYGAYLEKAVFRIEVWLRAATREGDAAAVRDLRDARAKAALDLDMARVDLALENEEAQRTTHGVRAVRGSKEAQPPGRRKLRGGGGARGEGG